MDDELAAHEVIRSLPAPPMPHPRSLYPPLEGEALVAYQTRYDAYLQAKHDAALERLDARMPDTGSGASPKGVMEGE